ncbi:putative alpha-1,6-mannosyltransferase MNN10 [Canna indica]|uniref:Alpha-1,6-mannosyltransferase MNN10 n=1 Tax=Canna indica TaxID=4628 RepID=A0AAQ3KCC0_9LILI|nr:putative alpha-1,6-mannosyltransferase MNN10 [Canna indica]
MAPRSSPPPPLRWAKPRQLHRRVPPFLLLFLCAASLLLTLTFLRSSAVVLRIANSLGRQCAQEYDSGADAGAPGSWRRSVAMVSFSDEGESGGGRRSFRGVGEAVAGNKRAYAAAMGYGYVDARGLVDPSRPPSWSKILAVRWLLPRYDWVFWNDADTMVMNPAISLENILHAAIGHRDFDKSPDLVVTEDTNGINAGVFFVRRSEWSEKFLQTWWNQSSFVQFGSTKSGDNDALKQLIYNLPLGELRTHIVISRMQCLFNSYPWVPTLKSIHRLFTSPRSTWNGVYSDGDFMVHLAGLDDKKKWVAKMLEELG